MRSATAKLISPATAARGRFISDRPFATATDQDQAGFTLIELLVVLVILPLVMGAVAIVVMTSYQTETGVGARVSHSLDSQITAAFFVRDVESADGLTTDPSIIASPTCQIQPPANSTLLLGLFWRNSPSTDSSPGPGDTVVSYWLEPTNFSDGALEPGSTQAPDAIVRYGCVPGQALAPTTVDSLVSSTTTPGVSIEPPQTTNGGWVGTAGSPGVSSVQLTVTEEYTQSTGDHYTYQLLASPRVALDSMCGTCTGQPPFLLLGTSCPPGSTPLSLQSQSSLTVQNPGLLGVDCSEDASVVLHGHGRLDAPYIATADPDLKSVNAHHNATCTGCAEIYVQGGPQNPYPVTDLSPPNPPPGAGSCQANEFQPGQYSMDLNLDGSDPCQSNGIYEFATGDYDFQGQVQVGDNNTDVVFQNDGTHTYVFEQPVSLAGNGNVCFAPGTYMFEDGLQIEQQVEVNPPSCPISTTTAGTLLYVSGGPVTFQDQSTTQLTAPTSDTEPTIWATDGITVEGQATLSVTGGVYVSGGTLDVDDTSMTTNELVAVGVDLQNGQLVVGGP